MPKPISKYFDNNASTPLLPEVKKAIRTHLDTFGNASSLHRIGQTARERIEESRSIIAQKIGTIPNKILFTSSATEANNQVLKSILEAPFRTKEPCHILYSAIEHSSIRSTVHWLCERGIECDEIPVDTTGLVKLSELETLIKPHTKLVSVLLASNEVGTIQNIEAIQKITTKYNINLHVDAVQALGKIAVSVKNIKADYISLSAHKIYGPKGIAALYVKNEDTISALLHGGGHERRLRAGTENTLGILGFKAACEAIDISSYQAKITSLRNLLLEELKTISEAVIHTPLNNSLCNTLNVGFEGVDGHHLAMSLDLAGYCVSTGSACSSGSIDPSPVLAAMGIPLELNKSSIRISLGLYNTEESIHGLIKEIKATLH